MNCELKYFKMEDRDKLLIPILIMKGKSLKYLSQRFGLTQRFIKEKFSKYYRKVSEATIEGKQEPYYTNEMMYGNNNFNYYWCELDINEKLAWYKYKKKYNE